MIELDNGRHLAQSNAIVRYLAAGQRAHPRRPVVEAKADELLFWEQYSHEPYVAVCRFQMVYLRRGPRRSARKCGSRAARPRSISWSARSKGKMWFVGDRFSIADIALLPYTRFAEKAASICRKAAACRSWIARCETTSGLPPAN